MMYFNLLVLIFTFIAFASAYLIFETQVCLYYGKALADKEFLKVKPRGFQDVLTDRKSNSLFFIVQGGLIICIIAFFYFFSFRAGVGSIVFYYLTSFILKIFLPPLESPKWALGLYSQLSRRESEYKRDGDELRYQASKELREMFEDRILNKIKN